MAAIRERTNMSNGLAHIRQRAIGAGFSLFRATGAHKLAARWTGGAGAILMFHRVRPWRGGAFAPNRLLEITPVFLAECIDALREAGFDIISLDAALARIRGGEPSARRFAVLTFDDGYRDNLEHALPVLRAREAPFTLYVAPGFADRTAPLWWVELEEAVRRMARMDVEVAGVRFEAVTVTDQEKSEAFARLYWLLRALPERELRAVVRLLGEQAGLDSAELTAAACMDWAELAAMASEPLCVIGAHTVTHPRLAHVPADEMLEEMRASREIVETRLGVTVRHFAYPVGDPGSAGVREFDAAHTLGFASAVTTRPGMVFAEHAAHLTALPRLSVNGNWQDRRALEILLSGAPFALWNRGRRLNVS